MLFLIKSDLEYIFSKRKSWMLCYFSIFLIFPILFQTDSSMLEDFFFIHIGLKLSFTSFLFIILYLFHFTFYLFLHIDMYLGNLKIGVDNVFLRISKMKVILAKIASCGILTFFFSLLQFLIAFVLYTFLNLHIEIRIIYFILFNIYHIIITMFAIIILSFFFCDRKRIKVSIFLSVMACFLGLGETFFAQPYLFDKMILKLFLFGFILFIIYTIILKKVIIKIFERSF